MGGMVHACVAMSCLAETIMGTLRVGHATPIAAFQPIIQMKRSTSVLSQVKVWVRSVPWRASTLHKSNGVPKNLAVTQH